MFQNGVHNTTTVSIYSELRCHEGAMKKKHQYWFEKKQTDRNSKVT